VAASNPKALPPARTMACTDCATFTTFRRSVSRVPGAAPRTSTPATAPLSITTDVHPVGRSVSVWCPTRMPGTALSVKLSATAVIASGTAARAANIATASIVNGRGRMVFSLQQTVIPSVADWTGPGVRGLGFVQNKSVTVSTASGIGDATDLRLLTPADASALEAFLAQHRDSSMFLRANARRAGLEYRGETFQAVYAAAFRDGAMVAVAAHCWNGMLLVQAPERAEDVA